MSWTSFEVRTRRRAQLLDITEGVADVVRRSGIVDGTCHVFIPHTTAGVTINEGADPDVAHDIEALLGKLAPKNGDYRHGEGNSDSHVKTALVGPSLLAPVRDSGLSLGTWQAIFLCEWDGPRTRTVEVAVSPV